MSQLLAALLRYWAQRLPENRRDWGEAVWSEAAEVPPGRAQWRWLAGGLWLVAREAGMVRRLGTVLAAMAAGGVLVWLGWHPGSENPAVPVDRAALIVAVTVLAVLPWAMRPFVGPVAGNRTARLVRAGGYVGVYALLLVIVRLSRYAGARFDHFRAFDQANWEADMRSGAVVGAVVTISVLIGYGMMILILTSDRIALPPATLALGAAVGIGVALLGYAAMPAGRVWNGPLSTVVVLLAPAAVVSAGILARRRSGGVNQGAVAGLLAGAVGAVLLAVLAVSTMVQYPRHAPLKWENPDPRVPHGTPSELQMSVSDASVRYEVGLLLGPLLGLALGALGGLGLDPEGREREATAGTRPEAARERVPAG